MEDDIKEKLYLNPLQTNTFRKKLNPIRQKILLSSSLNTNSNNSAIDILKGVNGSVIMQNWNTKKYIPRDIGDLINCPTFIDKKKVMNLKKLNISGILKKKEEKLLIFDKLRKKQSQDKKIEIKNIEMLNESIKQNNYSKILVRRDIFKKKLEKRSVSTVLIKHEEDRKSQFLIPLTDRTTIQSKDKNFRTQQGFVKINKIKKSKLIDFSTFKSYLYLKENDFLYAKRVGGPFDFVLCSYYDINPNFRAIKFKSNLSSNDYSNQRAEYLTISKNNILHYRNGVPHIRSIGEWIKEYINYKQLLQIPLIKNFNNAKLFELWKKYYRKKKRVFYLEKFKKKSIFVDLHLLKGIVEIRKIFKNMTYYELLRLNVNSPVFLNRFNQIHSDTLNNNIFNLEKYRIKIKREISSACKESYLDFKKEKNITLDDPVIEENDSKEQKDGKAKNKEKGFLQNEEGFSINAFLKDSIPYAQDATRKTHFKKLLRYIRLIDFLYGDTKVELIKNSLKYLGKRFSRLYECYQNNWNDTPILIVMIVALGEQISYSPAIELIKAAFFDNFIHENINVVINIKNFVDPEEFPQYMSCFEEVFDITMDQNGALNARIKEDFEYKYLMNDIKKTFANFHKALDETAMSLTPSLLNYNKFMSLDFNKIESESTHNDLNNYIKMFKEEREVIYKLRKKVNIGIFEFNLESFMEQISNIPNNHINKIFIITPIILNRKMDELSDEINTNLNSINFTVPNKNIELFIKLKKAVELCVSKKPDIEDKIDEIQELNNIINTYKEIKFEDFERRKYDKLTGLRTNYDRKLDSMIYFIEQNIKQFRQDLISKIKKYDQMLHKMQEELNEEQINKYSEDTIGPMMLLEEKSFQILKAVENKKLFQQQEIDLDIEENNKSNFENLDNIKYDYDLKMSIWKNLNEFKNYISETEKKQIMEIELPIMEENLKKWRNICIIANKDLDGAEMAAVFLSKIEFYQKVEHILKIIHNENIQKIDYLKDLVRNALNISGMDFSENTFTLEKLININKLFDAIPILDEINLRANEEHKIKEIYKTVQDNFNNHHIPFKIKLDNNNNEKGNAKYIIDFDDFDKEQEFIEGHLYKLNKELMNHYISVIESDFRTLVNNVYKYQFFLDTFYEYQIYMLNVDNLIFNSDFAKELPGEFKKLSNESLTRSLIRTLKDCNVLNKYIEYGHERTINNLRLLINNYEQNFKAIRQFLKKKRKEFQDYYLLNDEELINLIIDKDSYEIRQKLLIKLFPYIESIEPGKESDENLEFVTKEDKEHIILKYNKTTRTFKDSLECIESGLSKKIKEFLKNFKKNFDNLIKTKSNTKPKNLVLDLICNRDDNNNCLYQLVFICAYHVIFYHLEKTLEKENEAFDKMFDFYHELKDDWEKNFIKILKTEKNSVGQVKLLISVIAIISYFIKAIENLIREDVTKATDFSFSKLLQIKIENEFTLIKILNFNFEYGNEYVGLKYDFFLLPETERSLLAIFNTFYYHKPFLLYNNQEFFKNELLKIISNILGRNISYFISNRSFDLSGLNNIVYGNMRTGNLICIKNTELMELNLLKTMTERINEIFRLIHSKSEEGFFIDRNNEKFSFNIKRFNLFLTYNIDSINLNNKNHELPLCIKNNFRNIGINYIDFYSYAKLLLNSYKINRANEIASKIKFIMNGLIYKDNLMNRKNLREVIFPSLFNKLKNQLLINRNVINKKSVNDAVKRCLLNVIIPFLNADKKLSEDIKNLINITFFDYEEVEKLNNLKKNKKSDINTIKKEKEETSLTPEDNIFEDGLKIFTFDKKYYLEKIKNLYFNLKERNSFILLGPCLSGKSNALIYLKEITTKLNNLNKDQYPIFTYIKIYPNFKSHKDVFISNNITSAYQMNNIYIKNMINFLDLKGVLLNELFDHYKKIFFIPNKDIKNDHKENNESNTNNSNNTNGNEQKNFNDNINEYKSIIFDGSISYEWCSFLTNYLDSNNNYTLHDGDFINLSNKKIIFETTSLTKASPSFITKQNIISFDYEAFDWLNISYAYLETNYKTTKNEELKNYIKGLFENYLPKIIDFILSNKLKNIDFCINKNFIVKNMINIFDAFLPDFDFTDIKIGRRNYDYIPRIDIVKNQTLSIFIFCSAWIMNFLTNFLIKNKIEKAIGDIFKSDDLKGPIFDYYLDSNNSLCLWNTIFNEEKYPNPSFKKNTVFYYGHNFVYSLQNFKYIYIFKQMITGKIPIFFFGKNSSGLSFLIKESLNDLELKQKIIKQIKIKMTYNLVNNYIQNEINTKMDKILRRMYGDRYQRQTLLYIDDVHLCGKSNRFNEYMRYLLNEKLTYDDKDNMIKYYDNFNIVNSGNYFNNLLDNEYINNSLHEDTNYKDDFIRYMNQFSLITLNVSQQNYTSFYKPTMEFHFRTYIPNISNIISNQYLAVLFKMNELLNEEIKFNYSNIHYYINIRDITKIIQQFNKFIFRGTTEYTEYLKKLFLYESYCLYSDKFNDKNDIKTFKKILIQSFNASFKQDKLDISIFDSIDKDFSFIYCKNFLDVYEENKEKKFVNPKNLEYVFVEKKSDIKKYVISKIKEFYNDFYYNGGIKGTEDINFEINEYNDYMINTIIRLLRILDNEYPNIIMIGNDFCGKEILIRIALYIMRYNYININMNKLINKNKEIFEEESIIKTLAEVVFNNKKIFLIFQHDIFNNLNKENQIYIFELISSLLDPDIIMEKYKSFKKIKSDKEQYYNLDENLSNKDMKLRIKNNLQIILSVGYNDYTYRTLFLNYPNIVNNFYSIFIHQYDESFLQNYSLKVFSNCENTSQIIKNKNILLDIFNFAKIIYESFGKKIGIEIPINQRNYMSMCDFFSKNYKKYKDILSKKKENFEEIFTKTSKVKNLVTEKEKLLSELMPKRENNDKLIDNLRKQITMKISEKNKIKEKRKDEDKLLKNYEKEKESKLNKFTEIFHPYKESIRKIGTNITKFNDKDIVDCKNTWENFTFGKFLLQKIFLFLGDGNGIDYDYVKKNITPKQLKRFINIDYIKKMNEFLELIKEITENPDFGGLEKYNKNYKLAGLICDYISALKKYYKAFDENIEIRNEITKLEKDIEERKIIINKHEEVFKNIDSEIDKMQMQIDNLDSIKNKLVNQLDRYRLLINGYNTFIDTTKENEEIWKSKKNELDDILKYFDYYMIFISAYANFSPILNYNNRQKLKNYILQIINEDINNSVKDEENKKDDEIINENSLIKSNDEIYIKNINFAELMYNIIDISGTEKELYTSSNIYKDFIRENFILLHLFKEKTPFILDYTHYAKSILTEYLEFSRLQNIQTTSYNSQDFKDKLSNCTKNGGILYIDGVNQINKIYYYFYSYINHQFTGDKYKRFVTIDDHKYDLNNFFKIYMFKNTVEKEIMKIGQNIFFNMLIINFNIRKEDIKDQIFTELCKSRNEQAYASLKKIRNDIIKQSLMKLETENKMIKSILLLDTSGSLDKLQSTESLNEKFKTECQLYSNVISTLKKADINYKKQKLGLYNNYGKLASHASILFKWIFKFNLMEICYLINPEILNKYLMEFYDEKIIINRKIKELEKIRLKEELRRAKDLNKDEYLDSNVEYYESEKVEENENEEEILIDDNNNENLDENIQIINPVKSEEFIYNSIEDTKSLFIFFYNKFNKIYINKDLNISFLLLLSILCVNLQNKNQISFKNNFNNYYILLKDYEEYIEKDEIKESPIQNISTMQWTILNKLNSTCGELFQSIINNIESKISVWNSYLSETLDGSIENHYYLNDMILPDEELEKNINQIIKFFFFLIVKPNKKEFIINQFIQNTLIKKTSKDDLDINDNEYDNSNIYQQKKVKEVDNFMSDKIIENYDNYGLIKAFQNFNLKRDNALLLMTPNDDINKYDDILYNYCYLKMFKPSSHDKDKSKALEANNEAQAKKEKEQEKEKEKEKEKENIEKIPGNSNIKNKTAKESSSNRTEIDGTQQLQSVTISGEIKYKEIILENADLTQHDYDFIKTNVKMGIVIIIKNGQYLGNFFNELLNDIYKLKPEEISPNFKLVIICNKNEIIQNKFIYQKCRIIKNINSDNKHQNQRIKNSILKNIGNLSNEIYTKLLNNTNIFLRLFLRKLVYHYLLLISVLENYTFKNPFFYSYKDLHCLCKYFINFMENELQTEEKYNDFMNLENNAGYNYQSLFYILNNLFIYSKQIEYGDKCKVNELVEYIFSKKKNFMEPDFYLNINNIQIKVSQMPLDTDITFKDIYNSFNFIYSSNIENLKIINSLSENMDNQNQYGSEIFQKIYSIINNNITKEIELEKNYKFNMNKIMQILLKLEENIPCEIPYIVKENAIDLENSDNINPSLFKKNKFGIYYNGLDESLYYEISLFNKKLNQFHQELYYIMNMIKGKFKYKNEYLDIFSNLNESKIPKILNIYNGINYLDVPLHYKTYVKVIKNRISMYKSWLKEGKLEYYHLPIFDNVKLFIHSLKMNFCKKYYGENEYSKVTPDRINIKFVYTKFKSIDELNSNAKILKYYNNVYKNEIIWADGLIINNAFITENGKLNFNNEVKNIKNKMNVVGITYSIEQIIEENNSESESNSDEEEEEENDNKENEEEEEKIKTKTNKIKVYIHDNRDECLINKYYDGEAIGYIEFESEQKIEQDFIYENNIRITIEDLEDFL